MNPPTDYDPDQGPEWHRDDDAAEVSIIYGWIAWAVCVGILTATALWALTMAPWGMCS